MGYTNAGKSTLLNALTTATTAATATPTAAATPVTGTTTAGATAANSKETWETGGHDEGNGKTKTKKKLAFAENMLFATLDPTTRKVDGLTSHRLKNTPVLGWKWKQLDGLLGL